MKTHQKPAFTLIEILVATTVFVAAISIVATIMVSSTKAIKRSLTSKRLTGYVRDINEKLSDEMRTTSRVEAEAHNNTVHLLQGNIRKTLSLADGAIRLGDETNPSDNPSLLPDDIKISAQTGQNAFVVVDETSERTLRLRLNFATTKGDRIDMDFETMLTARN